MSNHINNELGVHLNQRTQILEDLLDQSINDSSKTRQANGMNTETPKHSKVSVMLDRFLEICPAE